MTQGQVTTGYYKLADGVPTMTDSKGASVRRTLAGDGEKILHKMKLGDNERSIAGQFTLEIYFMLRGETASIGRSTTTPRRCPNRSMER